MKGKMKAYLKGVGRVDISRIPYWVGGSFTIKHKKPKLTKAEVNKKVGWLSE